MKKKEKSGLRLVKWALKKESKEKETEVEMEPSDTQRTEGQKKKRMGGFMTWIHRFRRTS